MDLDDAMSDVVLAVNCGSSSLKLALFEDGRRIVGGTTEGAGEEAFERAMKLLDGAPAPTAIGHRVVHGGARYVHAARIDARVLADLDELVVLAPLHMPAALAGIRATMKRYPGLPHVACFDTEFHGGLPEVAARLPLPPRFAHVRRYGFHGLSYASIVRALGEPLPSRIVIAHLGSGASLAAVRDGRSVDTTMGFTPDGGVMMGTRTGDLDPGTLVYILRHEGLDADALERVVTRESGLAAVGGTSDVRTLLRRDDAEARLALAMFATSIRKAIGALATVLGGIDTLVFTGGIGERAAPVRALVCDGLAFLGVELDAERNARNEGLISPNGSRVLVRVMTADEEGEIARETRRVSNGR